jgi:L-ribulose-5-phosphate 3-epimerase
VVKKSLGGMTTSLPNAKLWGFVNLGDGDIDWAAVRQAFADLGYTGWATTKFEGGDKAYLRDVVKRVDRLVLGL